MVSQVLKDQEFQKAVVDASAHRPVVLRFTATWCGPCRQLAPLMDQLAEQYGQQLDFYVMDVDENPQTPAALQVAGIPTIVIFKDGKMTHKHVGAVPKTQLENFLLKALD